MRKSTPRQPPSKNQKQRILHKESEILSIKVHNLCQVVTIKESYKTRRPKVRNFNPTVESKGKHPLD